MTTRKDLTKTSNKIGGILLGVTLVFSMVTTTYAADTAYIIHEMTGWSVHEIQEALEEDWRAPDELCSPPPVDVLLDRMRPYAAEFTGRGVKFECLASLAAFETGHFKHLYKNNIGGIVDLDGNYKEYDTVEDGIADLDRLLMDAYLNPEGIWYEDGYTVLYIAKHYNTSIEWLAGYVDVRLSLQRRIENAECADNGKQY